MNVPSTCAWNVNKPFFYRIATLSTIVGVALVTLGLLFLLTKGHPLPISVPKVFLGLGTFLSASSIIFSIFCCFKRYQEKSLFEEKDIELSQIE